MTNQEIAKWQSEYVNALRQGIEQDQALRIQLQCNHYPPVHLDFIPACKEPIQAVEGDNGKKILTLPNGKKLKAWEVVEGLHLDSFLSLPEEG